MILIGSKVDLREKRTVAWECAKVLAGRYSMMYLDVSAKTGERIQEVINMNIEVMTERLKPPY